jgi:hypothetical protein
MADGRGGFNLCRLEPSSLVSLPTRSDELETLYVIRSDHKLSLWLRGWSIEYRHSSRDILGSLLRRPSATVNEEEKCVGGFMILESVAMSTSPYQ